MSDKPRIRCSELPSFLKCPGSYLVRQRVARMESDDGILGSAIHWEIAWRAVKELGASQPPGGIPPLKAPPGYVIPAFSAWMVDWAVNILQEIEPTWAMEVEVELEWEFDRFILTGHEDYAATSPDGKEARDGDWKSGRIPVDAADVNDQSAGYIVLRRLIYGVEKVTFEIGQPLNDEDAGFQKRSSVTIEGAEALDRLVASVESRVNAALDDLMLLNTGPSQCKYCVGLNCPALRLELPSMKMRLTPEQLAGIKDRLDDAELVDLVADAKTLVKPIDDAIELLKGRLETNPTLVGASGTQASLKIENAGYKVVDPVGMFHHLEEKIGVDKLAPALSYPSTAIKVALAKGLGIPQGGKSSITAEKVFGEAAERFAERKTKTTLILT